MMMVKGELQKQGESRGESYLRVPAPPPVL
jgi:hypothetical protein